MQSHNLMDITYTSVRTDPRLQVTDCNIAGSNSPHSSGPASPSACLLVGASASNTGFSARLVTLVPCLGSRPW
jgi:hypothetical protein